MKVKQLYSSNYEIVAIIDDDACPVEDFLTSGEDSTQSTRTGLLDMMEHIAEYGFHGTPSKWTHEASKNDGIYELTKGRLRVFYFKGKESQIVVCTHGIIKKTQKADPAEVARAKSWKDNYLAAVALNQLKVITDEDQQQD